MTVEEAIKTATGSTSKNSTWNDGRRIVDQNDLT